MILGVCCDSYNKLSKDGTDLPNAHEERNECVGRNNLSAMVQMWLFFTFPVMWLCVVMLSFNCVMYLFHFLKWMFF